MAVPPSRPTDALLGERDRTIDCLRGIAILLVVLYHWLVRWTVPEFEHDVTAWRHVHSPVFLLGRYGVQIFFVISGFVIAMTLMRSASALEFAARRFARLFPALLLAASLTFAVSRLHDPFALGVGFRDYLLNLTFIGSMLGAELVDSAYWTLSVEVRFYAFAALCWFVLRERFWIGLIGFALLALAADMMEPRLGKLFLRDYNAFFLLGVALWQIRRGVGAGRGRVSAGFLVAMAVLAYGMTAGQFHEAGLPDWAPHAFVLGAMVLVVLALGGRLRLNSRWLAWVGLVSYSLYLLHQILGIHMIRALRLLDLPDVVVFPLTLATFLAASHLAFTFVERPGRRAIMALWRRTAAALPQMRRQPAE
ncbi:acyltransferase [Zavarzinia compransoris]|uniref:acyltransferase family protein n=1 Tax=Zavarzinia marina TaxID=2911065 RepID=UPI001F200FC3|nr:acyltransferase [Zavarzinia marina]MCF4164325.1 acyltransferase [Zavarzinia marina]